MALLNTDEIIRRIADLQGETGLFPAIRSNSTWRYQRPDTNVFFTAITVFTLQRLQASVTSTAQSVINQIAGRAAAAYPLFRNKDGLNTYNFWPTRPSRHFPNGYLFRRFEHFRIPDDIDDTAMVYLTTQPLPEELDWLKGKVAQHANGVRQQIRNTYADYRQLRAYSTWFGKNMGIDFDACALSNLLYCICYYKLPLNQHDIDSLTYLRSVVESGRYVTEPFRVAPHYARTSLIIYHLARLMNAFDLPELEPIRPRLIADAYSLRTAADNRVEQSMLSTALAWLGESPLVVNLVDIEQDFGRFHFFIAGLLTAYEQAWLRRFADRPLVQMRWQCEAHCWVLVAEYQTVCSPKR
ncbi:hypothetical protein HNV11_02800 [Spirosoma taeanense]|uniref:Uncharacterized protein n=1 Tax=Spirosoma taeanense TaxID=2735870 RepID=A0A6M5YDV2_9BACT|nr:hypothetical protein [Spirosoma taeanense]QJW92195.1 hypothetical protein HNV11_02800 [Spirosoma taeanense]